MNDLQHDIQTLCRRHRTGSFATRADRAGILHRFGSLVGAEFRKLRLINLSAKHIQWYVHQLRGSSSARTGRSLSSGTQKNVLAAIRWLLEQVGKSDLLRRDNQSLGFAKRGYVTNTSKAIDVSDDVIAEISRHSPWAAASLGLTRELGLRIEESFKIILAQADRGDEIRLTGSWCKGGVPRAVPVFEASQRVVIDASRTIANEGSMIPLGRSYVLHRNFCRAIYNAFGIHRNHGLRHQYAQRRYLHLTGWPCPACGGPIAAEMTESQYKKDRAARLTVSREMGHGRIAVVAVYLGSPTLRIVAESPGNEQLLDPPLFDERRP